MRERNYRVAHIMPWPTVGGTEQATLRIAEAVRPYGFESVAFCPGEKSPVHEMFAAAGFETVSYHPVEHSYRRAWPFLRYSWQLARAFRRSKIDLVHCADLLAAYYAALAGKMARLPIVCHIRCAFDELSWRDRSFLWPIDSFIFVSRDTWRRFAHKVDERRGTVVYDGIDCARADARADEVKREFGIPDDHKIVGMVSRVAPAKDFSTLAKAAVKVIAEYGKVTFLIVGDHESLPAYRAHYALVKKMLSEQGLDGAFVFTGFRRDVARLLAAMDLFVLSTHGEGLPLVVLEAMAHGKPVIATAVGGLPEIVKDGVTGLLHAHGDAETFAEQMLDLLRDDGRRQRMGAAAQREVRERWSKDRFARDMIAVYSRALGLKDSARGSCECGVELKRA